jgi:hypothetical protein
MQGTLGNADVNINLRGLFSAHWGSQLRESRRGAYKAHFGRRSYVDLAEVLIQRNSGDAVVTISQRRIYSALCGTQL